MSEKLLLRNEMILFHAFPGHVDKVSMVCTRVSTGRDLREHAVASCCVHRADEEGVGIVRELQQLVHLQLFDTRISGTCRGHKSVDILHSGSKLIV